MMSILLRRLPASGYMKRTIATYNQEISTCQYKIRQMMLPDVSKVMQLLNDEKWIMEKAYLQCAYSTDPSGFYVAESVEGDIIGTANFLPQQDAIVTAGLCVVRKDCRNSFIASSLTDNLFNLNLSKNIAMFVKPNFVNCVERHYGFSTSISYMSWYNHGRMDSQMCLEDAKDNFTVIPVDYRVFTDLVEYDTGIHPVPRPEYLRYWINNSLSTTYAAYHGERICGYGVLRSQDFYNQIGPLYADNDRIALILFKTLASHLRKDQIVGFSSPVTNCFSANVAVQSRMMKPGFPLVLMSTLKSFDIDIKKVYALSSVSFGIC